MSYTVEPTILLVLGFGAFRRHLAIEPFGVIAVIVDHVVVSDPLHLPKLSKAQLAVGRGCPPVGRRSGGALGYADRSGPLASPRPEIM